MNWKSFSIDPFFSWMYDFLIFLNIAAAIVDEDAYFTGVELFALLHPDNLVVSIRWHHAVADDTQAEVCCFNCWGCGEFLWLKVFFIQEVAGAGRNRELGYLLDNLLNLLTVFCSPAAGLRYKLAGGNQGFFECLQDVQTFLIQIRGEGGRLRHISKKVTPDILDSKDVAERKQLEGVRHGFTLCWMWTTTRSRYTGTSQILTCRGRNNVRIALDKLANLE